MMHYVFPTIEHVDQIRNALQDRAEFKFTEKNGYIVVCYAIGFEDTFDEPNTGDIELDNNLKLRREARGIIFCSSTGKVISRRFHKFFNVNEKPETQLNSIDLSLPHIILEKLDGSMVTPYKVGNNLLWGTKRGETDVSESANKFVSDNEQYIHFANDCLYNGYTPIFEWCTNKHRIVISHETDKLILTAIRSMVPGEYLTYNDMLQYGSKMNIPVVKAVPGSISNLDTFLKQTRDLTGIEGFIIRFENGHMLKIKTNEYIHIHKAKDSLSLEKNVWKIVLNDKQDDLLAVLPEEDAKHLIMFANKFNHILMELTCKYETLIKNWIDKEGSDQKKFAIKFVNSGVFSNIEKILLFSIFNSKFNNTTSILKEYLLKQCNTSTNINKVRELLNNLKWEYNCIE